MGLALIRLEDIGPGGWYESEEQQAKLLTVAQYLNEQSIPFHVAVIPRYVDPGRGIDRTVADRGNDVAGRFRSSLHKLEALGGSLGVHGYTHQYADSVSGDGFEFAYPACTADCPPDDPPEAVRSLRELTGSYAYSRLKSARNDFAAAGLTAVWFETPHYAASTLQREIIEACCGLVYESPPHAPELRTARIRQRAADRYSSGSVYVPTPLYYVAGDRVEEEVDRIRQGVLSMSEGELASFFYHPYLEFPYIRLRSDGTAEYGKSTPLKRIVSAFQLAGRTFVHAESLLPFLPDFRQSGLPWTGRDGLHVLSSSSNRGRSRGLPEMLVRKEKDGIWYRASLAADSLIKIENGIRSLRPVLAGWPACADGTALVADFDGDGRQDAAVWDPDRGLCHVALASEGGSLSPSGVWLDAPAYAGWDALAGDFNGDGQDDLLLRERAGRKTAIAFSDGSRFAAPAVTAELEADGEGCGMLLAVGDVNGDGACDLVGWSPEAAICRVWLGGNDGLRPGDIWYLADADNQRRRYTDAFIGDVDGDGLGDLILADRQYGYWGVLYSRGSVFRQEEALFGPWLPGQGMIPMVLDLTGAGRTSLLAWRPDAAGGTLDAAINIRDRTNR